MKDEAMKQWLEALEASRHLLEIEVNKAIARDAADAWIREKEAELRQHDAAIATLSTAIEQMEKQEPVAWMYWQSCLNDDGTQTAPWVQRYSKFKPPESVINKEITPLYTTPPNVATPPAAPVQADPDEQVIRERDEAEAIADALAEKIAAITGCEIGEHTSANSPWHSALDAADEFLASRPPAAPVQEPVAWAKQTDKKLRITHMNMQDEDGWKPLIYGDNTPPAAPVQYPLPDDMYDSKDWKAGSYVERVEWLHMMYESSKQTLEAYTSAPVQEPVAWMEALKDAFFEGFTSVETYNDTLLNSPEEAWAKYKPPVTPPAASVQQEPVGRVVSANCEYATVQWLRQTSEVGGGDPKNSRSWPIAGDAVYTTPPAAQPAPVQEPVAASRPRCRDCADFGPICPNSGKPCTPPAAPVATNCRHCGGPDNVLCAGQCKPAPVQDLQRTGCSAGTDDECTNKACARACPALAVATQPAPVQEPAWYHAECNDPDYSRFTQEKDEAFAIVSDKGGHVTELYTRAQPAPVQEPVAYAEQSILDWLADNARGPTAYAKTTLAKRKDGEARTALYTTPPAAPAQEPVAWRWVPSKVWGSYVLSDDPEKAALAHEHGLEVEALCKCTTPPAAQRQWVWLTDEEIMEVNGIHDDPEEWPEVISEARAIEAKLREKNGGAA